MAICRVVLCALVLVASAQAEDLPLRWKFTPGESQPYRMTQTAQLDLNLGGASDIAAEVNRVFDFVWSVESVADEGTAIISVNVSRVTLKVVGPGDQETEFDTESDEIARGYAATLAPLFKALIESELKAEMNSRGELSELQIPEELQIALNSKPAGKALGRIGSEDDFRSLLQLGVPVLPESESFGEGEQWETNRKLETVPFGLPSVQTVYRWETTRQAEGEQLAVIVPTTAIRLNAATADEHEEMITGQETSGEILFDLTAGRLQSSQVELQLELNSTNVGQSTKGTLVHTHSFEPREEELSD